MTATTSSAPQTSSQQRVAVVTGAAGGIGAAVARRLGREAMAVAVLDQPEVDCSATVQAITDVGGRAVAVPADVADEAAVAAAARRITSELGPPTILVNNAGIGTPTDLLDMSSEQWDRMLGVNLRGAFLLSRAVCPGMIQSRWGRIVNISSVSALGDAGRSAYASAKAGLIGFTKSLALELGQHGVTANAIAPGFIISDMTAATARRLGRDFTEHQRLAAEDIPVGRVGRPEDIAHAVSFLVSEDAGFTSGQVLYVAGGPVD